MALMETRVGPIAQSDGSPAVLRSGKTGEAGVVDVHGRYYEQAVRGGIFLASNQAGLATQAGLSTNSSVFTLFNPVASGKNLVLLDLTVVQTAVLGAAGYVAIWLAANLTQGQAIPATLTSLTVRNALLGSALQPVGAAYSQATLAAAPVVIRQLGTTLFGTAAVTEGTPTLLKDEIAGSLVITPGMYVSVQASAAVTLACAATWEEVSV